MLVGLKNRIAFVISSVVTAAGLATGFSWGACSLNCNVNVIGCSKLNDYTFTSCCVDLDGDHTYHCVNCLRDLYQCGTNFFWGPYYGCTGAGPQCGT